MQTSHTFGCGQVRMRLELHLKTGSLLVYWYKNMILKTKDDIKGLSIISWREAHWTPDHTYIHTLFGYAG